MQARGDSRDAQVAEDGRPIFLDDIRGGSEREAHSVALKSVPGGLLRYGEIAVRQTLSKERPKNSRPIGTFRSGIPTSDGQATNTIADTPQGASAQADKVARVAMRERCEEKRAEEFGRCASSHRRAKPLSVSAYSLAISGKGVARLADARAKSRGKEARGRDAFVRKELQLLFAAQWAGAGRKVRKEDGAPCQNLKRGLEGAVALAWRLLLLGRGSLREIFRFRVLLGSQGFGGKKNRDESQSPRAEVHVVIVAWAQTRRSEEGVK